ncbi:MAG: histidine phosphatase family protein [Mycolicibacterium sp.]|uniref:histidine phosphatase family protein n=1 Tax=Mycolicibacterium sp. TaxID=2320850 RepID=UPI003D0F8864
MRATVAALTFVLFLGGPAAAWAAESITMTLVRHAQTTTNAEHILDTLTPGPNLSAIGQAQADVLASILAGDGIPYDGIYASTMVRTQQTAQPFSDVTGLPIVVLNGLQEINAGDYEGAITRPQSEEMKRYVNAQTQWMLGDRVWRIPGSTDPNGYVFDARVDAAIQQVYDSGDKLPVVFSHRGTVTSWTMMNVKNPDMQLALRYGLTNTGVVTISGNPTDGWTLLTWNGVPVNPNPTLATNLFVDYRDLVVAWQTAFYNFGQALRTGDLREIVRSAADGIVSIVKASIQFPVAVIRDTVESVVGAVTGRTPAWPDWDAGPLPTGAPAPPGVDVVAAALESPVEELVSPESDVTGVDVAEADGTVAEVIEADATVAEVIEADATVAEVIEADGTVAEVIEADGTVAEVIEADVIELGVQQEPADSGLTDKADSDSMQTGTPSAGADGSSAESEDPADSAPEQAAA